MIKKIFISGSFDVLHVGHIAILNFAKSLGDFLIVGLDSDSRIRQKKGLSRPFNVEKDRKLMLKSLKMVNEVHIFENDQGLEDLIRINAPEFLVVGSDWKTKNIIGSKFAKELIFFDRIGDYSTTKILNYKL